MSKYLACVAALLATAPCGREASRGSHSEDGESEKGSVMEEQE